CLVDPGVCRTTPFANGDRRSGTPVVLAPGVFALRGAGGLLGDGLADVVVEAAQLVGIADAQLRHLDTPRLLRRPLALRLLSLVPLLGGAALVAALCGALLGAAAPGVAVGEDLVDSRGGHGGVDLRAVPLPLAGRQPLVAAGALLEDLATLQFGLRLQ